MDRGDVVTYICITMSYVPVDFKTLTFPFLRIRYDRMYVRLCASMDRSEMSARLRKHSVNVRRELNLMNCSSNV